MALAKKFIDENTRPIMADDATPRERWRAILERKKSDRPPLDYWATDEVRALQEKAISTLTRYSTR